MDLVKTKEDVFEEKSAAPEENPESGRAEAPQYEIGQPIPGFEDVSFYETEEEAAGGRKNYKFFISHFEEPIEMILYLLKIKQIEIKDLFVSDITGQYLEIISHLETFDEDEIEYAGEFIVFASKILYMKSVTMLPIETDETLEVQEMQREIIDRAIELNMFKEMAIRLKNTETVNTFFREPVYSESDYRLAIKNFSMDKLLDVFAQLISRFSREEYNQEPKKVIKERYSVSNRMNFISLRLYHERTIKLSDLFDDDFSKLEIINTFLAVLELVKRQQITVDQQEEFTDITLSATDELPNPAETDSEYTEEEIENG